MLQPKRTKFRKALRGRIHGDAKGGTSLNFGSYGLKAMEPERITARQIEAARRAISRAIKRQGRLWIRIFPDVAVSSKPAEVRMGSGKGAPEFKGNIFVGGLRVQSLVRLVMDGDKVVGEQRLLTDRKERIRDVIEGPAGEMYLLTDAVDGKLLKVTPAK